MPLEPSSLVSARAGPSNARRSARLTSPWLRMALATASPLAPFRRILGLAQSQVLHMQGAWRGKRRQLECRRSSRSRQHRWRRRRCWFRHLQSRGWGRRLRRRGGLVPGNASEGHGRDDHYLRRSRCARVHLERELYRALSRDLVDGPTGRMQRCLGFYCVRRGRHLGRCRPLLFASRMFLWLGMGDDHASLTTLCAIACAYGVLPAITFERFCWNLY